MHQHFHQSIRMAIYPLLLYSLYSFKIEFRIIFRYSQIEFLTILFITSRYSQSSSPVFSFPILVNTIVARPPLEPRLSAAGGLPPPRQRAGCQRRTCDGSRGKWWGWWCQTVCGAGWRVEGRFQHVSGENQIYDFEYDKIHFFVKTWFGGKGYSAIWWWGWEAEIMAIFTIGWHPLPSHFHRLQSVIELDLSSNHIDQSLPTCKALEQML